MDSPAGLKWNGVPDWSGFRNNMVGLEAAAENLKNEYCKGDKTICGRYVVAQALGREKVPESSPSWSTSETDTSPSTPMSIT